MTSKFLPSNTLSTSARFQLRKIRFKAILAVFPNTSVRFHPLVNLTQRRGRQPTGPFLRFAASSDEASALERFQVLGKRWSCNRGRLGKFAHGHLTAS